MNAFKSVARTQRVNLTITRYQINLLYSDSEYNKSESE